MRDHPPDRDGGAPRRHSAETPEASVYQLFPDKYPRAGTARAQQKIALSLSVDPAILIRHRQLAVCVLHRLRYSGRVSDEDASQLDALYQEQRRLAAWLWQVYQ